MENDWSPKPNHYQALSCLNCIMFITYISIYNEYRYSQNIDKNYTKYWINKNLISMTSPSPAKMVGNLCKQHSPNLWPVHPWLCTCARRKSSFAVGRSEFSESEDFWPLFNNDVDSRITTNLRISVPTSVLSLSLCHAISTYYICTDMVSSRMASFLTFKPHSIRAVYHLPIFQCSRYFGQMIHIVSIIKCITMHIMLLI